MFCSNCFCIFRPDGKKACIKLTGEYDALKIVNKIGIIKKNKETLFYTHVEFLRLKIRKRNESIDYQINFIFHLYYIIFI